MATQWRAWLFRVWIVLTVLWCLAVMGFIYWTAVDYANSAWAFAQRRADEECKDAAQVQPGCVEEGTRAYVAVWDATVQGYLNRRLTGWNNQRQLIFLLAGPPLVILVIARIVAWVRRRFRGAQ